MAVRGLVRVLDIRLREELREARSGVYGAAVNGTLTKLPEDKYSLNIFFGSAPDRVEQLTRVVLDEVKAIRTDLDLTPYLETTKAQYRRDHENGMEQNSLWAGALRGYIEDDALNLEDIPELINLLDNIDTDHLRQAANQYLTNPVRKGSPAAGKRPTRRQQPVKAGKPACGRCIVDHTRSIQSAPNLIGGTLLME